jgi:hypothetical protein
VRGQSVCPSQLYRVNTARGSTRTSPLPVVEGDDEIETEDGTLYSLTPTDDWSRVDDDEDGGRSIDPIEWTGGDEEFSVNNITDAEVNTLNDENGEIRYEKVFKWALPRFGNGEDEQRLSEFQAARMRNNMRKRIVEDGWTPKYYTGDQVITGGFPPELTFLERAAEVRDSPEFFKN